MITGVHLLFCSKEPEQDRAFFRDTLGLRTVDIGHGRLIFALPPTEAAAHPADSNLVSEAARPLASAVPYLMCDDLKATMKSVGKTHVAFSPVTGERWRQRTSFRLPNGSEVGLCQPSHPTALNST